MVAMKIQHSLRIIFACALIALVTACVTAPRSGPAALAGTWTNSLGTVWTIKTDGTFDVVNPKRHIWGKYTVTADTVTIQETGGKAAKGCKGPGVYKFNRPNENTLTFTLVNDACGERKRNVLLGWHQK
jgi:hypothetical protein